MDPLAEQFMGWTPYHYVHQNPINLVDPTGMSAEPPEEGDFNDGDTHTDESGSWTYQNRVWYDNTGNDNNILAPIVIDKSSTDYIGIAKEVASYLPGGGLVDIYDGLKSGNNLQVGIGVVTTVADVMSFGMGGFVIKGGVKALIKASSKEIAEQGIVQFSKKVFGHTFTTHGDDMTEFLINRAKGSKSPQGQFLDNQKAADFIRENLSKTTQGAIDIPIPKDFPARVIMPDGSFKAATHIKLVPGGKGVKTAYPLIK